MIFLALSLRLVKVFDFVDEFCDSVFDRVNSRVERNVIVISRCAARLTEFGFYFRMAVKELSFFKSYDKFANIFLLS